MGDDRGRGWYKGRIRACRLMTVQNFISESLMSKQQWLLAGPSHSCAAPLKCPHATLTHLTHWHHWFSAHLLTPLSRRGGVWVWWGLRMGLDFAMAANIPNCLYLCVKWLVSGRIAQLFAC